MFALALCSPTLVGLGLTIAQNIAPPMAGGDAVESTVVEGQAEAGGSPFGPDIFLFMLLIFGGIIIFSMMSQRKQRKKQSSMIDSIAKNDTVQTIGGIVGSVVEVKSDRIVLKVDETSNTRIAFAPSAIQQVLSGSDD